MERSPVKLGGGGGMEECHSLESVTHIQSKGNFVLKGKLEHDVVPRRSGGLRTTYVVRLESLGSEDQRQFDLDPPSPIVYRLGTRNPSSVSCFSSTFFMLRCFDGREMR